MHKLPKKLQNRPFTYTEATESGLSQYQLNCLLKQDEIERVERGLYQATGIDFSDEELFKQATKLISSKSAVCLLSALSYYQLTDIIPKKVWLMVPASKRTKHNSVKLFRTNKPNWNTGIVSERGFKITSVERTIIDCLTNKSVISVRVGIDALKLAIQTKHTTGTKILNMADALNVKHRVLPYLEVLA